MKKYVHKSRKYIATLTMYGNYEIVLSDNRFCGYYNRDLIEDSSDWIEMVEAPIGEYFSKKQVEDIIEKVSNWAFFNMGGTLPLKPAYIINNFKTNLLALFKIVKKEKLVATYTYRPEET